jgi:hypothetical protein
MATRISRLRIGGRSAAARLGIAGRQRLWIGREQHRSLDEPSATNDGVHDASGERTHPKKQERQIHQECFT